MARPSGPPDVGQPPPHAGGAGTAELAQRASRFAAGLVICENTVPRLPLRFRVLWLVVSLAIVGLVGLLAALGLAAS